MPDICMPSPADAEALSWSGRSGHRLKRSPGWPTSRPEPGETPEGEAMDCRTGETGSGTGALAKTTFRDCSPASGGAAPKAPPFCPLDGHPRRASQNQAIQTGRLSSTAQAAIATGPSRPANTVPANRQGAQPDTCRPRCASIAEAPEATTAKGQRQAAGRNRDERTQGCEHLSRALEQTGRRREPDRRLPDQPGRQPE